MKEVMLADLTFRCCRWPLGDPQQPDFRFCGEPRRQGSPYCDAHHGLAYVPRRQRTKQEADEAAAWRLKLLRLNPRPSRG